MLITIDSNISDIPTTVASYLGISDALWCKNINRCSLTKQKSIYYNSPISMADSLESFNFPKTNVKSFIYIDHREKNAQLARIMKNIQNLQNVVIFSNADIHATGKYHLHVGNCTNSMIAEFIAAIIKVFQSNGRLIHPDEMKLLSMPTDSSDNYKPIESTDNMVCDLYSIFEYRQRNSKEIDDCRICTI